MKDQAKQQNQKVTSTEEVELTEEELDQASGGWSWGMTQTSKVKANFKDIKNPISNGDLGSGRIKK